MNREKEWVQKSVICALKLKQILCNILPTLWDCGIIVHLQGRAAEKREKEIQNASHIINKTIQICFSSFV